MIPKGVRCQCPECTFSVVMKNEQDLPTGITKVIEGAPYCPNCNIAMKPVASVDTTERPKASVAAAMTLDDVAAKCVELQQEAAGLQKKVDAAHTVHKDLKKELDGKLISLSLAVERLGRVMGGEEIEADKPLLRIAEQEPGRCAAVTAHEHTDACSGGDLVCGLSDAAVQCVGESGHGGPHGNGDVSWETLSQTKEVIFEVVRQRLAALQIVVEVVEINGWSLKQYDAVIDYADLLESGESLDDTQRPPFLSLDVPEYITALHRAFGQLGIVVGLAAICGWTPGQRASATEWATTVAEHGLDAAERPEHVPAPAGEPQRIPARRGRRRKAPVAEHVEDASEQDGQPAELPDTDTEQVTEAV